MAEIGPWHGWHRKSPRARWRHVVHSVMTAEECHAKLDQLPLGGERLVLCSSKDPNKEKPRQGDLFADGGTP